MIIKLMTNNIWRYYDWEKRKQKVIDFLKNENPEIIFLQEVAYDERLKNKYKNQIDEINKELNYKSCFFGKLAKLTKWHKKKINWEMWMGLGILSKFKIKKAELVHLPIYQEYGDKKQMGFLYAQLETQKGDINIINVHFANNNQSAKLHLKETLEWCKKKQIEPIIAGDFNVKIIKDLIEEAEQNYHISYLFKEYKSFFPNEFSHDKSPVTLDYILVHKNKFKFIDVKCFDIEISDHKPIIEVK